MKKSTRLLGSLLGLACLALPMAAQTTDAVQLSFTRTGTTAADVTVSVTDAEGTAIDGATASVSVSHEMKATGSLVTDAVLCPNVNATAGEDVVFTISVTGLPAGFTFDAVEATTWALNATGAAQSAGQVREWNLTLEQGADESSLSTFATLTNYNLNNAQPSKPLFEGTSVTTDGALVLRLTAAKGDNNGGCFLGLEDLTLTTAQQGGDEPGGDEEPAAPGYYLSFLRSGTTAGDVAVSLADAEGTPLDGVTATLALSHDMKATAGAVTDAILCPNVNVTAGEPIVFTLTLAGLPAGFTFDAVEGTTWALNSAGNRQELNDGKPRLWNLVLAQGADEASLADWATLTDYELNNAQPSKPLFEGETVTADGTLVLRLTATRGTTNDGCFFGLEGLRLYTAGEQGGGDEPEGDVITFNVDLENGALSGSGSSTYKSLWSSTQTEPQLTLNSGANNMKAAADGVGIELYRGTAGTTTYTLSVPHGWLISSYSFDFTNSDANENMTVTPAGAEGVTAEGSATATVSADGIDAASTTFTVASANNQVKAAVSANFIVKVVADPNAGETPASQAIFSRETGGDIPYRIPAITRMKDGSLLAIADYRYCKSDIGAGHIDIKGRISTDNGKTWGEEFMIADGSGVGGAHDCGYGDGALVTDSATGHVLMMCCSGNRMYGGSTRQDPLRTARLVSTDGGRTWSAPEDVTEEVYGLFDEDEPIAALFFGSGRIAQSHLIKVGDYYRIYAALCTRNGGNRVVYSDDFGDTWKVLGGAAARPAPGGDEPKCEELPDGRVLLSSRMGGGRYYNIFTFSDMETGEGSWGTVVASNGQEGGVTVTNNSTNGEILIIPAVRNEDGKQLYLALQSIPFGSGRANVGIWYKGLESYADYATPATFASGWDGSYQVSYVNSCYSTMVMQSDGKLAFLYEETGATTPGGGYDIVYTPLDIETITDGAYSLDLDVDRWAYVAESIDEMTATIEQGKYVGQSHISDAGMTAINGAIDAFKAAPSLETYEAIMAARGDEANLTPITFDPAKVYRIYNPRALESMSSINVTKDAEGNISGNIVTSEADESADYGALWRFEGDEANGYKLLNLNAGYYVAGADNATVGTADEASIIEIGAGSAADNWTLNVTNTSSENTYLNAHHCDDANQGNPKSHAVGMWKNGANDAGNLWMLEPVDNVTVEIDETGYASLNLPFTVVLPEGLKAYAATEEEADAVVIKEVEGHVPAGTAVLLNGEAGTYTLTIVNEDKEGVESLFRGTTLTTTIGSDVNAYILAKHEGDDAPKLYLLDATERTLAANKAYYVSETSTASFTLKLGTTGIESSLTDESAEPVKYYDLSGRRVLNPTKGLYVTDKGRKVLVR